MAGTSLLALLDDIATVLDDVAVMTKVAARKTAGVLGDDLALNAQQVLGIRAERELPVVWAVALGSLRNKLILIPAALVISAIAPWAVTPLLMVGGAFLCYEGFEKLAHRYLGSKETDAARHAELARSLSDPDIDLVAFERDRVRGAIRTDFVLSAEIIIITLGIVAGSSLQTQIVVLTSIGLLMTVGVYGLVAAIVKLDDVGFHLQQTPGAGLGGRVLRALGESMLAAAPRLMKALAIVGTAAMFLVGGGILVHGIPGAHEIVHVLTHLVAATPAIGPVLEAATPLLIDATVGVIAGAVLVGVVALVSRLRRPADPTAH
jgi:predicted DNA repair protein MutK